MIRSTFRKIMQEYEAQTAEFGLDIRYKILITVGGHILKWPPAEDLSLESLKDPFSGIRELRWDNKEIGAYYLVDELNHYQQTINNLLLDNLITKIQLMEKKHYNLSCGMGVLDSAIKAIEAKDRYTRGHSDRVAAISLKIVKTINEKRFDILKHSDHDIEIAAKLHDIGKIGISEIILTKPGSLSTEEINHIKQHPALGAGILTPITLFKHLIPAIRHHHERYDGKGYPDRLAGEDIPIISRIISVADTFDALTSNRPYRKALDPENALIEIARVRGTQLDPNMVDIFMSIPEYHLFQVTAGEA